MILRGHSHDRFAKPFPAYQVGTKWARSWVRVVAHTGSYKLGRVATKGGEPTHDTWELTRGFPSGIPELLGPPRIIITPSGGDGGTSHPTHKAPITYECIA
jgi:hypothetical protein